jgi:hypothetical protein
MMLNIARNIDPAISERSAAVNRRLAELPVFDLGSAISFWEFHVSHSSQQHSEGHLLRANTDSDHPEVFSSLEHQRAVLARLPGFMSSKRSMIQVGQKHMLEHAVDLSLHTAGIDGCDGTVGG